MANCLTCIHQEVCKERMAIFNLPNITCQYEEHELKGEWIEHKWAEEFDGYLNGIDFMHNSNFMKEGEQNEIQSNR